MKRLINILPVFVLALLFFQSCYDDYYSDYDYSTVYFAVQNPVRTVVVEEGKDPKIELGVVLGGKYTNPVSETVQFEIAPDLLAAYPQFKLLPASYYALSNPSEITIPGGEFLGTADVVLNQSFLSDNNSVGIYYALPVRIKSTSADSVLQNKNHTIIAIKYQNKYYGSYWVKGVDNTLSATGQTSGSYRYSNKDLSKNNYTIFSSKGLDISVAPYTGLDIAGKNKIKLTVSGDGAVAIGKEDGSEMTTLSGSGTYSKSDKKFFLNYTYEKAGVKHQVNDTLIWFATPMSLETWK